MQTRRDYLVGLGLAKPGRGKFSGVAKAALDTARAAGTKFSDDDGPTKNTVKPKATVESEQPEVVGKTDPKSTPYLTPDEFRYPASEWKAVDADGKEHSMKECCNLCRVSLVGHACEFPTILGDIRVTLRPR